MQSSGLERHRQARHQNLLASGHAYRCFCRRKCSIKNGKKQPPRKTDFKYDRDVYQLTPDEVQRRLMPATRRRPLSSARGSVSFTDAVVGESYDFRAT
jgi:glutamyl/glutaminyl-tRNA synthetase